jgi:hypothetical protein
MYLDKNILNYLKQSFDFFQNNQISHDEVIQRSAENNSPDKSPLLTFSEVVTNTLLEDDG